MSTYVSIGRNIGGEPMPDEHWASFKAETVDAVERFAGPVVTAAEGVGEYDGQRETTFVVVGEQSARYTGPLWDALGTLARQYGQEAIALTVAEPVFVGATQPAGV